MQIIYRPLATLVLGMCFVANLVLIVALGLLEINLALMDANEVRNLGLVIIGIMWAYGVWTLAEFIREIPMDYQDIWR